MIRSSVINFNKKNVKSGLSSKGYGYAYFATRDFEPGEEVMRGWGKVINHQTSRMSVQIGENKHYLPEKWTGRYWNHSCNPNTHIKTRSDGFPSLYALKKIKIGQEITYHYSTTELKWAKHAQENYLKCLCNEDNCSGRILSFSQLTPKEKAILIKKSTCSNYLLSGTIK